MKFERITKNDENHAEVMAALEDNSTDRTDYNDIAKYYNSADPGDIFHFEFPKAKFPSLVKQLEKRGLVKNVDFTARSTETAATVAGENGATETKPAVEKAVVARLTDKVAQILTIVVNRKGGRKPKADAAAAAAASASNAAASTDNAASTDSSSAGEPASTPAPAAAATKGTAAAAPKGGGRK